MNLYEHPLSIEDTKMEALVAISWEEESLEQVREGPPRTCKSFLSLLFVSFLLSIWKVKVVFTFRMESESSFVSTSLVISGIIFSS